MGWLHCRDSGPLLIWSVGRAHALADFVSHSGVIGQFHGRGLAPWWMGQTERTTFLTQGAPYGPCVSHFHLAAR